MCNDYKFTLLKPFLFFDCTFYKREGELPRYNY
jgi:hypothetical protein